MDNQWYAKKVPNVFEILNSNKDGLTNEEAKSRLTKYGFNKLPESKLDSLIIIFLRQFQSPLIYILFVASLIVFLMKEFIDGSIILFVLFFNAIVGTIQEGKAQNTLLALKKFAETNTKVIRDGKDLVIPDYEVVPGDVIILQEGEKVPADARIIESNNLTVNEAAMTGESQPVYKFDEVLSTINLPTADQRNMVFKGTNIVAGNGRAVVVATGLGTVLGKISKEIAVINTEIPLKANIRYLTRLIIITVATICTSIFVLGILLGHSIREMFTTVVSLAVSIIPEGLPIVMTLVLATGVWRMSKRNAFVKKLQAVEALGQARVIAVDKTGTITKNELVVREVYTDGKTFKIGGVGYEPKGSIELGGKVVDAANHPELLLAGKTAALCASARVTYLEADGRWRVSGDPTEAAIRVLGEKVGFMKDDLVRESPFVAELPFDYKLKYHATVYKVAGKNFLTVEGAPEAVLELCTQIRRGGENRPMRKQDKEELEAVLTHMSERGLRVVAGAVREQVPTVLTPDAVRGLTFVSLFGMQDALRPEVANAMERATAAGIRVVMITGDHKLTARAIAKDAGIWKEGDKVYTGAEIDEMSDAELAAMLEGVSVFARVNPEHKLRIVNAYKKRGEIIEIGRASC